jgi:Mn2+/Fe2+ NRAMP family transporter
MTSWNKVGAVVVLASAIAVVAAAQGKDADKAALEKTIIANEQKLNDAVAKGDLGAFKALVSSGAWSIDSGGPMSVSDFEKNFKQAKIEPGSKITETRVLWIASNTAVLLYKWTGKGTFMGQPLPPVTYCSTVWHKSGDKWAAEFHQESAAAPGK